MSNGGPRSSRRTFAGAALLAAGCAADPVSVVPDGGSPITRCAAPDPLPLPPLAVELFGAADRFPRQARLLTSAAGTALAFTESPPSAFGTELVPLRRYERGGWSPPEMFPEPIHEAGPLTGAMSPAGDALFIWSSLDAPDPNSVNLHERTLAADGTWSDEGTVGDTSVGWWQDPRLPQIAVAAGDALSVVAWPREDPTGAAQSRSLWANQRRAPLAWAGPETVSPQGTSAPVLVVRTDGTARAVWTSSSDEGLGTLLTATWNGAWSAAQMIDQASADARFDLGGPGSGLELAPSGEMVIVYARVTSANLALLAATSAGGQGWTTETVAPALPVGASWRRVANAAGQILVAWGSPPDHVLHVTVHSPDAGWSAEDVFPDVRDDAAMIALAGDGRAAIADAPVVSVPPDCAPRTAVRVRRYDPTTGWADPEVIDDAVTVSAVTALGYAGDDLLLLWHRSSGGTYAKSMP